MNTSKKGILDDVKKYMDSIGFVEDDEKMNADYSIYDAQHGERKFIRLVFRLKNNREHINYFVSQGWDKGKSYRNYTSSPSMWEAEGWTRGCSTGVFMATLEFPTSELDDLGVK